jgi:SAM-dependent methyltransferase
VPASTPHGRVPFALRLDATVAWLVGGRYYARFARDLALDGDEDVLDVGSGTGVCARAVARRLDRGTLTCQEIEPDLVGACARTLRRHPRVTILLGELPQLDLEPGRFDVVTIHFVLHDVAPARRGPLLQAVARTLAGDGRVVVREPTVGYRRAAPGPGLPATELRRLASVAGLRERHGRDLDVRPTGPIREATLVHER